MECYASIRIFSNLNGVGHFRDDGENPRAKRKPSTLNKLTNFLTLGFVLSGMRTYIFRRLGELWSVQIRNRRKIPLCVLVSFLFHNSFLSVLSLAHLPVASIKKLIPLTRSITWSLLHNCDPFFPNSVNNGYFLFLCQLI